MHRFPGIPWAPLLVALVARLLVERGGKTPTLPITPRPPFHPVPLAHLAGLTDEEEPT